MPDDDTGHFAVLKQIWFDDKITLERSDSTPHPPKGYIKPSLTQGEI